MFADFPQEGGQFRELLKDLSVVARGLTKLEPEVSALASELQKLKLTPTEETLLSSLGNGSGPVDLGAARAAVGGMDEGEFWHALSGLQAKRRVRITIERIS